MNILITGADGFIGTNLRQVIHERDGLDAVPVTRDTTEAEVKRAIARADVIVHLAGVNRPADPGEFMTGNGDFTGRLCELLIADGRAPPVIFASSIQAGRDNPYGSSKRTAEEHLAAYAAASGAAVSIYRLPNVFGKWCRPNYNSAVATFCHNIAHGLPIEIHDPTAGLRLVYIDDVIDHWLGSLTALRPGVHHPEVAPVYEVTVGELAQQIGAFGEVRTLLETQRVGTGLIRALYATYMSYLPATAFAYDVPGHEDPRGIFVEMLKTKDSGQFAYFTAHPGITRGGHYHHSKTEKFLVIRGTARFRFRHILTGETYELIAEGHRPAIVETIPGWTHDITNIGDEEMLVMLWANEQFDRERPDTFACPV